MYDMIPSVYVSVPPRNFGFCLRWLAEALLTKLPSMEAHLATWPLSEFWRLDGLNGLQIGVILTIDIHWDDPPSRWHHPGTHLTRMIYCFFFTRNQISKSQQSWKKSRTFFWVRKGMFQQTEYIHIYTITNGRFLSNVMFVHLNLGL